MRAVCRGAGIVFSLNESSQGSLAVELTTGAGSEQSYCLAFGGNVIRDPSPAACPEARTPAVGGPSDRCAGAPSGPAHSLSVMITFGASSAASG